MVKRLHNIMSTIDQFANECARARKTDRQTETEAERDRDRERQRSRQRQTDRQPDSQRVHCEKGVPIKYYIALSCSAMEIAFEASGDQILGQLPCVCLWNLI